MLIAYSVGQGGANQSTDVRTVQILLNDWRGQDGLAAIAVDGLVGPETIGAITLFQQRCTGLIDGRVDPGGPAIYELASWYGADVAQQAAALVLNTLTQIDWLLLPRPDLLPLDLRQNLIVLRTAALSLKTESQAPAQVAPAILAQRVSLPLIAPQVIGAFIVDDAAEALFLLALAFIIVVALLALITSPGFQRLMGELGKLLGRFADLMKAPVDSAANFFCGS